MQEAQLSTPTLPAAGASSDAPSPLPRRLMQRLAATRVPFAIQFLDGHTQVFGQGAPAFRVVLKHPQALRALATLDEGTMAEAYMLAWFDLEGDMLSVYALRKLFSDKHPLAYLWRFVQPLLFGQVRTNAQAIQSHYDLDPAFYLAFFGPGRCYTQGIYESEDDALEVATRRKFDFCFEACRLGPGSHVLEVGPGWGAFAEYASARGVRMSMVTNSAQSQAYMRQLAERLGQTWTIHNHDILTFAPGEQYDAVVLMGVMEHLPDYAGMLRQFERLLKPGGRVYLDASASRFKYRASSFTYRHIYPGNHSFFALHDFLAALARSPLQLRGVHDDQRNYYLTFLRWARRFESNRDEVVARFGEQHWRRFHLYLWGSAHSFLDDTLQCYRVVLEMPTQPTALR
jgi:cyclopropane-fatty-acyl-phospholipid synthase